jgi:hypothetical protein
MPAVLIVRDTGPFPEIDVIAVRRTAHSPFPIVEVIKENDSCSTFNRSQPWSSDLMNFRSADV